jgi:hypothetical protein
MPRLVGFSRFADLPKERISEKISRRILSGDQGMGRMVEYRGRRPCRAAQFERSLTHPSSSVFARSGIRSVSGHHRSQFHHNHKNADRRAARRFGNDVGYASSSSVRATRQD